MDNFIKLKADGKIRFRCTFCLALLETELNYCAPPDCLGCGRKIFVLKSPTEFISE
jgi:hypothetical protein